MSTFLYAAAETVPLWRVPVIAILFVVVLVAMELVWWGMGDDE